MDFNEKGVSKDSNDFETQDDTESFTWLWNLKIETEKWEKELINCVDFNKRLKNAIFSLENLTEWLKELDLAKRKIEFESLEKFIPIEDINLEELTKLKRICVEIKSQPLKKSPYLTLDLNKINTNILFQIFKDYHSAMIVYDFVQMMLLCFEYRNKNKRFI